MFWSLLRILIFVAIVAALVFGVGLLMETGPGVRIQAGPIEFNLSPLMSVIVAIVLLIAVWLVLKLAGLLVAVLRFLNGDETALSRYFDRNRERKGFDALAEGMMALASGEGRLAMVKASRAQRYLKKPELTNLVTAQAAEMVGDRKKAEATYKALLSDDKTRFVGIRGIMRQKLSDGDTETALKLAEKAFALKPKHEDVSNVLLKLQAENEDWEGARATLGAKLKAGTLPRDLYRRRDAILALSEARDLLAEGEGTEAQDAAIEANRLSPDLIPAAVMAARAYIEQGKPRLASKAIKKAWDTQPHPELATAFGEIVTEETPAQRIKRFATLTNSRPDHPESKMLKTELLLAAEDFPGARKALGDLAESTPTARSLTLMAAIEKGAGADEHVVRAWLARAVNAPRGPQWVCDVTGKVYATWAPYTEGGFDTLSWREPQEGEAMQPAGGAAMMPLLVGAEKSGTEIVPVSEAPTPDVDAADAELVIDEKAEK